jgi:hypothetical protein
VIYPDSVFKLKVWINIKLNKEHVM